MDADEHNSRFDFEVGDIVVETDYIVVPNREPWTGIVVYVIEDFYELNSHIGELEDLVGVHWLKPDHVETLPASVLVLLQKAKE